MIIFIYCILGFLGIVLCVTVFNACTAPMLKHGPESYKQDRISFLIPVRNEGRNIQGCLESLLDQAYPRFEILILDDHSSDDTAERVQNVARRDSRIRYIRGKDLPEKWTGKNWACHQLGQHAKGDIFIFTDADNRYTRSAGLKTVGWMRKLNLDMFSAFPQQYTLTLAEKLVVPSVYMTVYCYLPLWLTCLLPYPSLAAANGQWIAFTREAYQKLGGHEAAKNQIVEDTWLARFAKKNRMKVLTSPGTGAVYGRMYHHWTDIWQGFSKNLFGLMDYHIIPFCILLLWMLIGYVCPYVFLFHPLWIKAAGSAVALNIVMRSILALKYKDPWITILLHPLAILLTIAIGLNSIRVFKQGKLKWKGRTISRST
ncbi:glycosyltransferase [bacterium]|nr:glycosyltransferase [bacterium]